jgi:hypothetical protein
LRLAADGELDSVTGKSQYGEREEREKWKKRTRLGETKTGGQSVHHLGERLMLSGKRLLNLVVVTVRDLLEPSLREDVPALLNGFVVGRLSTSEVTDDNIEVAGDAAEEARKLLEELSGEEEEVFRSPTVARELLREVAVVVEHLVVALGDDLARRLEETEEMVSLEDEGTANFVVLQRKNRISTKYEMKEEKEEDEPARAKDPR